MNRKQYLLICSIKRMRTKAVKEAKRLDHLCKDIEGQHHWDQYVRAWQSVSDLKFTLNTLDHFIKLGQK